MKAVSLFSSGGIGDLALQEHGIEVIVANELLSDRAKLFSHNFPKTHMIPGDIRDAKDEVIKSTKKMLGDQELDFLLATPPCQGMSKNGQGKLAFEIRQGKRPNIDPRNRLIIPTLEIVQVLRPKTIVFENVPEMKNTIIDDEDGRYINIVDYIEEMLGSEYEGKAEVVEFADFGVPQRRKRLITIFTRDEAMKKNFRVRGSFIPSATHSKMGGNGKLRWVTVRDKIAGLPPLSGLDQSVATSEIAFHDVPVLDEKKYNWILNTPPEKGAFDNQCNNPECQFQGNGVHGSLKSKEGINRASTDTPIYCSRCKNLLPRPYTATPEGLRLMKGYTSAYKRMRWDLPSSTLTTNLQYPSSDHKLHPDQHRVLSLYEAFLLHTLDEYSFEWMIGSRAASKGLIRDVVGESIPPKGLSFIIGNLLHPYSSEPKESWQPIVATQLQMAAS